MGNSGSQTGQISQRPLSQEQQWAHSFPRTQPRLQQLKVIPDQDARQKLRHTDNGEILQSGGTLSGRQHRHVDKDKYEPKEKPLRTYLPNQRDPLHKSGSRYTQALEFNHSQNDFNQNVYREKLKKFGSEPDLRQTRTKKEQHSKKKYKAPPPPLQTNEKLEWEENSSDNGPIRRARLFKTRAETKKNCSSPVQNHKSVDQQETIQLREKRYNVDLRPNRLSLPEISQNFHHELKEVTTKIRHARCTEVSNRNKLKTLDHNIHKKDIIRQGFKQIEDAKQVDDEFVRGDGSGKESSSPDRSNKEQPKTFYFGMDDDIVQHFASNLHPVVQKITNSSESDISSDIEVDENTSRNGIDLQLRPILPKKQLEIPRFSPAAAWRLLSTVDPNPAGSTIASDDLPVFIEDRIEKYARPPPPHSVQIGQRSNNNDKSGDSGISGDAGPADDVPDVILNSTSLQRTQGISWTPQQDLGDDSSLEDGLNEKSCNFTNKPHVFSLSLPRENHLSTYMTDKATYTGLQKLKRSVSGVLGTLNNAKKDFVQPNLSQEQDDNWFLSKSAPNSLNNGFNSLENSEYKEQNLVSNSKSSGRLMYLPEFENNQDHRHRSRSKSMERSKATHKLSVFSKSCENISGELKFEDKCPENLQDPPKLIDEPRSRKPKRFAFQSTVRQIERRRLAEKLSKEAEKKEKQRLRELEAMQKVEEEFQKKRAREKASIRQQLRLFSIDDVAWTSLPPNLEAKDEVRQEPDGAVSSSNTSSPSLLAHKSEVSQKVYQKNKKGTSNGHYNKHRPSSESSEDTRIKAQVTQVLSEYRHPQREYKEYTGSTRYLNEVNESNHNKTTVHPQVICNMPKAKHGSSKTSGTNYRKDFAHGVKSTRSVGSTYSEDSQSRDNSPRMYHSKCAPITRF